MTVSLAIFFLAVLTAIDTKLVQAQSNQQTLARNASTSEAQEREKFTTTINQGTVSVISGGLGDTYTQFAADLEAVLDEPDQTLRILSVNGKGGVKNITDLLYLKGVDLAIVQSDILDAIERQKLHYNVRDRVHYIAKLYNSEFHIVTRTEITDIRLLSDQTVNMGYEGSASDITSTIVFDNLEIPIKKVYLDHRLALEKVKNGEIAATLIMTGKPADLFTAIKPEDGLHFLSISYSRASEGVMMNNKHTRSLADIYLPAVLTHEDYPGLIKQGDVVQTLAGATVLAAYNWPKASPRYLKVQLFVQKFFLKFEEFLKKPRHPKWEEVNLNALTPGWTRFGAAQDLLDEFNKQAAVASPQDQSERIRLSFFEFLRDQNLVDTQLTNEQKESLFTQFMKWQSTSPR